jgi:formate hydrogenlyase subunit 6/NADH:ubiquinone oxidoreductase subunit I
MKKNIIQSNWFISILFILKKMMTDFLSILMIRKKINSLFAGGIDRGFPQFTDKKNCTSCGLCELNCPTKAITISGKKAGENIITGFLPQKFEVDMLKCIQCGLCAEICPVDALVTKRSIYPTSYEILSVDLCQEIKTS